MLWKLLAVVLDGEPRVQVAVVPEQALNVLIPELVVVEHLAVRFEDHPGAIGFLGLRQLVVLAQHPAIELGDLHLPVPHALDPEIVAQCVHRLGTHAVETHAFLEGLAVVLGAGVDLAHHVDHLAQGHAAPVVAHFHARPFDGDLHLFSVAHHEFIDAVVQHFLQQDVNAVVVAAAVAQLADVHARPQPDVFLPVQRPDSVFAVVRLAHGSLGTSMPVRVPIGWLKDNRHPARSFGRGIAALSTIGSGFSTENPRNPARYHGSCSVIVLVGDAPTRLFRIMSRSFPLPVYFTAPSKVTSAPW